jgi:hypothetical protein
VSVEFISEKIEVERDPSFPRPVSFKWRGQVYTVAEIVQEWVDTGFGQAPPASRKWFNRRHRRYFVVRTTSGETFELYLDYANRGNQTWWLTRRREQAPADLAEG